jgi:hypothetical protein
MSSMQHYWVGWDIHTKCILKPERKRQIGDMGVVGKITLI